MRDIISIDRRRCNRQRTRQSGTIYIELETYTTKEKPTGATGPWGLAEGP